MLFIGLIDNITLRIIIASISGLFALFILGVWISKEKRNFKVLPLSFLFIGLSLNHIVVIANGGFMPSLTRIYYYHIWAPLTERSIYPFLCDRFYGSSMGDFFIYAGFLLFLISLLFKTMKEASK